MSETWILAWRYEPDDHILVNRLDPVIFLISQVGTIGGGQFATCTRILLPSATDELYKRCNVFGG
jgi:hypothetical protein